MTKKNAFSKDLRLVTQITDSAVSSMANIAEGFHRKSNKDFMKFLDYARASVAETVSHSYVAFDQHYISEEELELVRRQTDVVWKKVNNFIAYLNTAVKKDVKKAYRDKNVTNATNKNNQDKTDKSDKLNQLN